MIVGSMQLKVLALGVHLPEPLCILELPEHRWRESGTICTGLLEPRFVLSIGWDHANYFHIHFDRAVYGPVLRKPFNNVVVARLYGFNVPCQHQLLSFAGHFLF
jgi:hypothetical protein